MDRRWRRLLVAVGVVALTIVLVRCAFPGDALRDDSGIAGTYVVNGVDPHDFEYSGTVTIAATDDAGGYTIQWLVTGTIQEGTAVLDGDRLTATWRTVSSPAGDATGTASYTVGPDGVLTGTRSIDGIDGTGTEEIFPEP